MYLKRKDLLYSDWQKSPFEQFELVFIKPDEKS